ncbi:MAG: DUF2189 domain-containing protein [Gammaproteobacteria bacterium]
MTELADSPFEPPRLRAVGITAPLRWLGHGFADMLAAPGASLFYGSVLALMGWALVTYYGGAIGLALTTGFLLIGPFLAVGIYDISRQLAGGTALDVARTLTAWRANRPAIGFYALILMLSLAVWMRISVVLVALLVPNGFESLADFLALMARSPGMWVFLLIYLGIGALLATFSFAISAVALPMLLDRTEMDAISAMIASFHAICRNPRPMLLWAALIVVLIGAGFTTWFVGLVITVPLVGHATWHAYRDVVLPPGAP